LATIQQIIEVVHSSRAFKITETAILLKQKKNYLNNKIRYQENKNNVQTHPSHNITSGNQKTPTSTYLMLKQLKIKTQMHQKTNST
jgi:hypothetical protein